MAKITHNLTCSFYILLIVCVQLAKTELYTDSDPDSKDVVTLNKTTNFYRDFLGKPHAFLVQFYNSWCGHCISFAPTYKKLGSDINGWSRALRLAAIDCSNKENTDLCRDYNIKGYPTLLFFRPFADKNDTGTIFESRVDNKMRMELITLLSDVPATEKLPSWPKLDPLASMEMIWNDVNDYHQHVAIVFEDPESFIGRLVILDMLKCPTILVRRMLKGSVANYDISHYPSLYLINKDGILTPVASNSSTREEFVASLKKLSPLTEAPVILDQKKTEKIKIEQKDENKMIELQEVHMQDLESALHYSLRQEISIRKTIDGDALKALKTFIFTLVKFFPGRDHVMKFLANVWKWLKSYTSALSGEIWIQQLDQLQTADAYLPEVVNWICCKGSNPKYRGYPCGMWTLFHTLTVSSFIHESSDPEVQPTDVLFAINGYMKNFFGCDVCSENFGKMASEIQEKVQSPKDTVLWLWSAHNNANKRLSGDYSEDPEHKKIQFPSRTMCPRCHHLEKHTNEIIWDNKEVLRFLIALYKKDSIIARTLSKGDIEAKNTELDWWELKQRKQDLNKIIEIRQKKLEKLKNTSNISSLTNISRNNNNTLISDYVEINKSFFGAYNPYDLSFCVVYYVMCVGLIVVLYFHFLVRRRMNPCRLLPL